MIRVSTETRNKEEPVTNVQQFQHATSLVVNEGKSDKANRLIANDPPIFSQLWRYSLFSNSQCNIATTLSICVHFPTLRLQELINAAQSKIHFDSPLQVSNRSTTCTHNEQRFLGNNNTGPSARMQLEQKRERMFRLHCHNS